LPNIHGYNSTTENLCQLLKGFKHKSFYLNLRFIKEYEDLLDDLKDLAQNAEKTELIDKLNIYHQELNRAIGDDYYNHLRGEIVGDADEAVTKERFVGRLWSLFRNNETGAYSKKIEIPPYEIHDAVERFVDGRSLVKELERTKDTIEAASNKMQREINKISPLDFMSKYIPIDYDIEFATDRILKLKCGQLVEMCNNNGGNIPGAKGCPDEMLKQAGENGVSKINVDTDLRLAMTAQIRRVFNEDL